MNMVTKSTKVAPIISDNWITRLLQETNGLKDYALIPNMLLNPEQVTTELKHAIGNVKSHNEKANFRVFIDNGQRYDLLEKLWNTHFDEEADLDDWIQETIGYEEYCFTFNGVMKWNDRLHTRMTSEVIKPIIDDVGVPMAGVDAYAFIANAGYTPFGIHEDPDHSLIFHLGPDEKHVWIWKREEYLELTGSSDRRFDPENLVEHATHYVLKPGDCLFIPKGDFHVFKNVGFSSFLGFILYPSTAGTVGEEGIKMLTKLNGNQPHYFVKEESLEKSIYEQIDFITQSHRHDLEKGIKQGSYFYHLLLKSNGYAIHKPIMKEMDTIHDLSRTTLIKPACFPILHVIETDKITLFIRGRLLQLKNVPGIVESIKIIQSKTEITYSSLIEELTNIISFEVAAFLVKCAIQYKGLIVKEDGR
ncbi:hypothetical protein QTG56_07460 [Rossellomorea sp. AcN35-11]|nr:hypothetical protein [Rossellomorea aquimaris]WJV30851.1 hypothetical protein QTG56_07460 [Rossellomorea sp. AcN35-11]